MSIEEMIKELPEESRREVEEFVRALFEKKSIKNEVRLKQDWAGALREYREQYTSLDLQKKTLEWRGD